MYFCIPLARTPSIRVCVCVYIVCPTDYRNRHFFNNSNTNEHIAMEFEEKYVRCVRNEEECVCSAPNCCDMVKLLKKCRVRERVGHTVCIYIYIHTPHSTVYVCIEYIRTLMYIKVLKL